MSHYFWPVSLYSSLSPFTVGLVSNQRNNQLSDLIFGYYRWLVHIIWFHLPFPSSGWFSLLFSFTLKLILKLVSVRCFSNLIQFGDIELFSSIVFPDSNVPGGVISFSKKNYLCRTCFDHCVLHVQIINYSGEYTLFVPALNIAQQWSSLTLKTTSPFVPYAFSLPCCSFFKKSKDQVTKEL